MEVRAAGRRWVSQLAGDDAGYHRGVLLSTRAKRQQQRGSYRGDNPAALLS